MIFEVLQQVLGEFFVDVQEDNVSFYAGDLFESSHFKLSDVFLKTSLVNSLQLPFELAAGYVGNVTVEGLLGAVAGWPLEVNVSDVCLVLKPHKVPWENELLIRYARELIVAICHCLRAAWVVKKGSMSFTSPTKWIWSRLQTVGTDMIVQLERIHIRVESPRSDNLVVYGLYIPLIRFAPREVEEQILYRRQQPGVTYPTATDNVVSKLFTIENVSFYTDLNASTYWASPTDTDSSPAMTTHPIAAALLTPDQDISLRQFTQEDACKRFKEHALKRFDRDQQRELVFIRVIWVKLDLKRPQQNSSGSGGPIRPVLLAADIATEEIEFNVDFDQIAMILEELEHVTDYFKRARTWKWRPSCIDREHHAPPSVKLLPTALLPLSPDNDEEGASMVFSIDKQRKTRQWFRAMWRYAFRCVVDQQQRSRKEPREERNELDPRCWWHFHDIVDKELQQVRRQRYMHLYARSLSPGAMEIALYGRGKALLGLASPQDQAGLDTKSPPASPRRLPLPEFDPLTQDEQWELSDLVVTMQVHEQRVSRALAEQELRKDFTTAPPSPTRKVSSAMEFSVVPADLSSERFPHHGRSHSVDSISSVHHPVAPVVTDRHHKRGSTIIFGSKELSVLHPPPPASRPHAASTSDLPSPTKHENVLALEPLRAWIYKQRQVGLHTTSWFEMQFFPAWLLNPSKVIPLLNWQFGPMTVRISEGNSDQTVKRGIGVEISTESCSGAMLLSRIPYMRVLVEVRVGLFHVTLGRRHLHHNERDVNSENMTTEYKWISSDYIRSPDDGFLYIGLKYSAQEVTGKPNGRVQFVGNLEEELDLKGRMCIGPIKIDCNEAAMRAAMGETVADELLPSNMDVSTSTHFSVLQGAYHNFIDLVAHLPKKKGLKKGNAKGTSPSTSNVTAQTQTTAADHEKLEKSASRTRMLHALLLRSSTFEVEVGALELNLSTFTSHIETALRGQMPNRFEDIKPSETREDVNVLLPTTTYRLQNRPSMNECIVDVAGVRVVYRSTKQGRAAVIRHLAQLFKV